jgi:hypothetical protein
MKPPQALVSPPHIAVHSLLVFLQRFPQERIRHLIPHGAIAFPHYLFSSFITGFAIVVAIISSFTFL